MAENQKRYCGSGKEFGQYGTVNLNLCITDIPKEFITESVNGKKYIRLKINKKKETDKFGNTHSIEIDTWKSTPKVENKLEDIKNKADDFPDDNAQRDELPF